jgi:anti-sigma factor RsiW
MQRAVRDVAAQLSNEELAELCALADGTLPAERRPEVEARVAASPELRELVDRQRRGALAVQTLSSVEVPSSLQSAVDAERRKSGNRRRPGRVPRLALAGAVAAVAVLVAAVFLTRGPGAPTVADAARLATEAPTAPAPARAGTSRTQLAIGVGGVAFPDLSRYGWQAVGVRRGRLDGRDATVVVYGKDGRRLSYVIVGGKGLSRPSAGQATNVGRVEYTTLRVNDRLAVTWRRGGHTCVLIGQAGRPELLKLASWPLSPPPR